VRRKWGLLPTAGTAWCAQAAMQSETSHSFKVALPFPKHTYSFSNNSQEGRQGASRSIQAIATLAHSKNFLREYFSPSFATSLLQLITQVDNI